MEQPTIQQLEAALNSAEMLHRCRRISGEELERVRLAYSQACAAKVLESPTKEANTKLVKRTSTAIPSLEPTSKAAAALWPQLQKIRKLRAEQAQLSNQLHFIPKQEKAAELVQQILAKGNAVEAAWTTYRHIEKTGELPAIVPMVVAASSVELLKLQDTRDRYAQERSKLRKKLKTEFKSARLREKWGTRLAALDGILEDLDAKIRMEKNK